MLDGLDAVDWASLSHAGGEATDVPGLLRSLLSADPTVREGACYQLLGIICHQGTVYTASAAAVPFLYEMLTAHEVQDKAKIAYLTASIANGYGYLEVHAASGRGEAIWRELFRNKGESFEDAVAREVAEVGSVRHAASAGLHHLLPFLGEGESMIRWEIAVSLGNYSEHVAWALAAIEAALASETDERVRDVLIESEARLNKQQT